MNGELSGEKELPLDLLTGSPHLTATEFRVLAFLLGKGADPDGGNCYLSRKEVRKGTAQTTLANVTGVLRKLERKGWIVRHRTQDKDGTRGPNLIQFKVPPEAVDSEYSGPVVFPLRLDAPGLELTESASEG